MNKKNTILKVPNWHFYVYLITFIVSFGLIFCIFIDNESLSSIFVSLGTGGITSCIVGYFVDLANNIENKKTKEINLQSIKASYMLAIEKYIKNSFLIMKIYEKYDNANLYTFKISNFKANLYDTFVSYDGKRFVYSNDGHIISKWDEYANHKNALEYANIAKSYINKFRNAIEYLLKQDEFVLLKYYSQDEINMFKIIQEELDENITCLEMFYYIFDVLADKRLLKVLNITNLLNYDFYISNHLSGIYNEKDELWYGRLAKDEIKKKPTELFIAKDELNETKI